MKRQSSTENSPEDNKVNIPPNPKPTTPTDAILEQLDEDFGGFTDYKRLRRARHFIRNDIHAAQLLLGIFKVM